MYIYIKYICNVNETKKIFLKNYGTHTKNNEFFVFEIFDIVFKNYYKIKKLFLNLILRIVKPTFIYV